MASFGVISRTGYRIAERIKQACPPALRRPLGRLLRLQTNIAARLVGRAQASASLGRYAKAIRYAGVALRFKPNYTLAYELLAQVLVHLGQYEQALGACTRALEMKAGSNGILASLDIILAQLRNTDHPREAARVLKRCLAADPQQTSVLQVLVEVLIRSGRYDEALAVCERLLKKDPDLIAVVQTLEKTLRDPRIPEGRSIAVNLEALDEYNKLVAGNVADLLLQVMTKFYGDLGADISSVALVQALNSFRRGLPSDNAKPSETSSTLVQFERAWASYQSGQTADALRPFQMVFDDASARRRMKYNSFLKEAVIRSGEICGRHQEKIGNIDAAIAIYRQLVALDNASVVARRLLLLLARRGNLREAASLAEMAIVSRTNLYPHLPENPYIASLKKEMSGA